MTKIASVFDIDGTLSDDRWRRHLIDADADDPVAKYERYHLAAAADLPVNKHLVWDASENGHHLIFCTARPATHYAATAQFLVRHFNIHHPDLRMRSSTNHQPTALVKIDMAASIVCDYDHVTFYEDRKDVCDALRAEGCNVVLVELPSIPEQLTLTQFNAKPTAAEILRAGAETYAARNKAYGDNYKQFGSVMAAMFPNGVRLNSADEWNRFALFMHMANKITRFANADLKHADSAHDLMVYAAMAEELLHG